jgi:hypothetical protein
MSDYVRRTVIITYAGSKSYSHDVTRASDEALARALANLPFVAEYVIYYENLLCRCDDTDTVPARDFEPEL